MAFKFQGFFFHLLGKNILHTRQDHVKIKADMFNFQIPGFNLGQVQNIVDKA